MLNSKYKKIGKLMSVTALSVMCATAMSLTGCGNNSNSSSKAESTQSDTNNSSSLQADSQVSNESLTLPTVASKIPVTKFSLYINNKTSGYREKANSTYESTWVSGQDIVSFEAYATDIDKFTLSGSNFKNEWEKYWNVFENSQTCKIGYIVDFKLKDGQEIKKTITHPDDVFSYRNYLECYLYDDVNQIQGNWYSHLLASEVTDNTVMTSIKLTAGTDIALVGDTIKVTAFVYSSDSDFDADGNYTGNVMYSVEVKNN